VEAGESTVRQYVRERKTAMGLLGRETFVPQSYTWGGEGQVDCVVSVRLRNSTVSLKTKWC